MAQGGRRANRFRGILMGAGQKGLPEGETAGKNTAWGTGIVVIQSRDMKVEYGKKKIKMHIFAL